MSGVNDRRNKIARASLKYDTYSRLLGSNRSFRQYNRTGTPASLTASPPKGHDSHRKQRESKLADILALTPIKLPPGAIE